MGGLGFRGAGAAVTVHLLVSPAEIDEDSIRVTGDRYRHLFRARRLERGDEVRITDGRGRARFAVVAKVDRHTAWLAPGLLAPSAEPAARLSLAVATLRPERAAWLVEKATEIGAAEIAWYRCERAPRRFEGERLARLARVAQSAVEQCGRSVVPAIAAVSWSDLVARLAASTAVILDPRATARLSEDPPAPPVRWLVVGPEGGLTAAEIAELEAAGATSRALGERTLRAETAAVVALALALHRPAGEGR